MDKRGTLCLFSNLHFIVKRRHVTHCKHTPLNAKWEQSYPTAHPRGEERVWPSRHSSDTVQDP